jgi:hypothetical protein
MSNLEIPREKAENENYPLRRFGDFPAPYSIVSRVKNPFAVLPEASCRIVSAVHSS